MVFNPYATTEVSDINKRGINKPDSLAEVLSNLKMQTHSRVGLKFKVISVTALLLSSLMAVHTFDDFEDLLPALYPWGLGQNQQQQNCGPYLGFCNDTTICCQYNGFPALGCFGGICLQAQCGYPGQLCGFNVGACCWHLGLECDGQDFYGVCRLIDK